MRVLERVPSQKPVPASNSLGARKPSEVLTVVMLWGERMGTRMARAMRMARMMAAATLDLFLQKRRMASRKKVVGLESSLVSMMRLSAWMSWKSSSRNWTFFSS